MLSDNDFFHFVVIASIHAYTHGALTRIDTRNVNQDFKQLFAIFVLAFSFLVFAVFSPFAIDMAFDRKFRNWSNFSCLIGFKDIIDISYYAVCCLPLILANYLVSTFFENLEDLQYSSPPILTVILLDAASFLISVLAFSMFNIVNSVRYLAKTKQLKDKPKQ